MVSHTCNPIIQRLGQKDHEFVYSLGYNTAWATESQVCFLLFVLSYFEVSLGKKVKSYLKNKLNMGLKRWLSS